MKKILLFVLAAIGIGVIISLYYYNNLKNTIEVKPITIFQTGVYSSYDSALAITGNKNKIYFDGNLYHIYDAIVSNEKSIRKMQKYYNENNIEYFKKEKFINEKLFEDIEKYSKLIDLSDDKTIKIINNQIISKFGAEVL